MIETHNNGQLITSTTYWDSEYARAGKVYVSINAGAIRVLLPPSSYKYLGDMRPAEYCVLSRGPWPEQGAAEGIEIMWEDHTESPFALHLTADSFDGLPGAPPPGREWICSVWTVRDGKPHKAMERICYWRLAPRIPWAQPWKKEKDL